MIINSSKATSSCTNLLRADYPDNKSPDCRITAEINSVQTFLVRSFLRRPLFIFAILLVLAILAGIYPGCPDRVGEKYSAADARRLLVSGTVRDREITADGYRLILDHLCFSSGKGASSRAGQSILADLNRGLAPGDSLQASSDETDVLRTARIGDRITLYGKCNQPERATNPGQFDSRRYYLSRRIVMKMSQAELKEISPPEANRLQSAYLAYRNWISDLRIDMQRGLLSVFGSRDASQAAAYILGDGSWIDSRTKQLFRDGGLSWLVSVSSIHISLLGMLLYRLFRSRGISFLPASIPSAMVVGSYALLTGFSISVQRALVTFGFWLGAQIFGRARDTLTSLSAAAIFILARQPLALWDSSFLISYSCILSLEYLTPSLSRILKPRKSMQKKFCSSLCLNLGSLPTVLWFFYQATPFSILLYPVMLPLMSLIVGFGILSGVGGCLYVQTGLTLFRAAGRTCAWPCRILLALLRILCGLEQDLPGSVVILGRPAVWQMILYYSVLAAFIIQVRNTGTGADRQRGRLRRSRRGMRIRTALILGSAVVVISLRPHPDFRYTCLDIGQGSCNLIEHKGCAYLFDSGSSSVQNVWQYRIESTLKYYGIRKVDMVFLSHGDTDHINGIEQMLECYHNNLLGQNAGDVTIGRILIPDLPGEGESGEGLVPILKRCTRLGIETGCVDEGDSLSQQDMTLKILSPSPDRITGQANEDCIVMLLQYKDLGILFTGDLEKDGESLFVKEWRKRPLVGNCGRVILVAGHHGSKNATSCELLDLVKPDFALISCGRNNRYGHPAPSMLKRLEEAGIPYHRTDREGAAVTVY